jgi:heme/copper-type cytochrome/quinol oxidase subunit 2
VTDPQSNLADDTPLELSQRAHRQLVGYLGLFLPFLLYFLAGFRPSDGLPRWGLLDSISSYYYTGAVGIFVGVLFALSLFLFTYRGYKGVKADRIVGWIGGAAAMGVALFPTGAPVGVSAPTWWTYWVQVVHYVSAAILFVSFILFSIWLFRKSNVPNQRDRPPDKRKRDAWCLGCGIAMIISVLWAASSAFTHAPITWPEAIAIMAFATSWLVKGEARKSVSNVVGRLVAKASAKR